MTVPVLIRPPRLSDWNDWRTLWSGYNAFYQRGENDAVTSATWSRFFDPAEPVHATVAECDGALVGLVHYIFHRNTWTIAPVCYLQDLFAAPSARGRGVGRALIEAVYVAASSVGSPRVYWLTHETNRSAMALYDQVAERSGFVQYRCDLPRAD